MARMLSSILLWSLSANQNLSSWLAQFMNATSFRQRRLLRDHKLPYTKDGRRKPQIVRYSEARSTIQKYHLHDNDVTVLLDAVEALKKKAAEVNDSGGRIS
jgi:hypothetical protein